MGAPRPHILLFVVDDMGWAALGHRNPGHVVTPNFDAAAADGIILDRHYVHWHCSPTRRSLLTGRTPLHHGEHLSDIAGDDIDNMVDALPLAACEPPCCPCGCTRVTTARLPPLPTAIEAARPTPHRHY